MVNRASDRGAAVLEFNLGVLLPEEALVSLKNFSFLSSKTKQKIEFSKC